MPDSHEAQVEVHLPETADTLELGRRLAQIIGESGRSFIALSGPLGAGKTTLVQGIGEGLSVTEVITSPTFTMLNEFYSGRLPLFHLDLYRLKGEAQSELPGNVSQFLVNELDEISEHPGVILVEWAELLNEYVEGTDHLRIELSYDHPTTDKPGRRAVIEAHGTTSSAIVDRISNLYFSL